MKHCVIVTKKKAKKGGYSNDEMWRAHRLEGVVKNKAIKPLKKKKGQKLSEMV